MRHADPHSNRAKQVAIIGGGPAGLMACEVLVEAGYEVDLYEAMPTLGRKFLRAGLGGLNITHSEPLDDFYSRYGDREEQLKRIIKHLPPDKLRKWVHDLGIKTFVGSSGRIFPTEMKAAPLLRTWVHRLRASGVKFHLKHRCLGFDGGSLLKIANSEKEFYIKPNAVVLALGGASWPQLGSTGAWVPWLKEHDIEIASWKASNCGFNVDWSDHIKEKFAGAPLKAVSLTFTDLDKNTKSTAGELLITEYGVEGSLIYAFSKVLRDSITKNGSATFYLDLVPDKSHERVLKELSRPRGSRSISRYLQDTLGKNALKRNLLFEILSKEELNDPAIVCKTIKALPITLQSTRPIEEAISTAGGVSFNSLDENLMLKNMPGIFAAGEMIDWEAPTGGYLLTACFATGLWAGKGVKKWLEKQ